MAFLPIVMGGAALLSALSSRKSQKKADQATDQQLALAQRQQLLAEQRNAQIDPVRRMSLALMQHRLQQGRRPAIDPNRFINTRNPFRAQYGRAPDPNASMPLQPLPPLPPAATGSVAPTPMMARPRARR